MADNSYSGAGGYQRGARERDYGLGDDDRRERSSPGSGYYGRNGDYDDVRNREFGDRDTPSIARGWSRDEENSGMRDQPNAPRYGRGGSYSEGSDRDRGYGDSSGRGDRRTFFGEQRDARYRDVAARGGRDRFASGDFSGGRDRSYAGEERGFWDRAGDEVASWFGDEDAERRRRNDQFRGKGPRNYQRSDTRILEDVNDRLSDDPMLDASDIDVTVSKGEVTLSGHVGSRFDKRRAEDLAESVSGAQHVQNNLRVKSASTNTADTTKSGDLSGESSTSRRLM